MHVHILGGQGASLHLRLAVSVFVQHLFCTDFVVRAGDRRYTPCDPQLCPSVAKQPLSPHGQC